jgi:membrane-bound ClpP family serine protease
MTTLAKTLFYRYAAGMALALAGLALSVVEVSRKATAVTVGCVGFSGFVLGVGAALVFADWFISRKEAVARFELAEQDLADRWG